MQEIKDSTPVKGLQQIKLTPTKKQLKKEPTEKNPVTPELNEKKKEESAKIVLRKKILPQNFPKGETLDAYDSILELFKSSDQNKLLSRAQSSIRNVKGQAVSATTSLNSLKENRVKHIYDLHTKYSMAVVCFIFLFIGAPMGAIVRKGGFGYPILIAICFFILFVVLTIFCKKLAESFALPVLVSAWLPCLILFPLGLFLTLKAMNDSKLMNFDQFVSTIKKFFQRNKPEEVSLDGVVSTD